MRAIFIHNFGGPDALNVVEIPTPEPRPGQLRIKVAAAAINPVDLATRAGHLGEAIPDDQLPVGIGWDVAGMVDAVGTGVDGFAVGDAVTAIDDRLLKDLGTYAEYVVLDADAAAPAPRTADLVAASTLPLNAITAVQSLDLIDLEPDQTLLVTGAAGAVGGYLSSSPQLAGCTSSRSRPMPTSRRCGVWARGRSSPARQIRRRRCGACSRMASTA